MKKNTIKLTAFILMIFISITWIPRSLTRVTNWVRLKFAAMNLKRLAVWRWKERFSSLVFLFLSRSTP